eukprot:TRINITY_DN5809_c1_g1_i1.p1 TRINITY_DN5809_c1_g1~~TRINITY_DN5809_c1_g1_i1.p1  ORF type:complete len:310 (+),score=35.71 TRINITY_DN5809_c1_g1_i1:40-969(+)
MSRKKEDEGRELAGTWSLLVCGVIDGISLSFFLRCILVRKKLRKIFGCCCLLNVVVALWSLAVLSFTASILNGFLGEDRLTAQFPVLSITHNLLWKIPLVLISYPLNYVWLVEIFEEAYKEKWKAQASLKKDNIGVYELFLTKVAEALRQGMLLTIVLIQTEIIRIMPAIVLFLVTWPVGFGSVGWEVGSLISFPICIAYEAWVYSFYAFGFRLDAQPDMTLTLKTIYFETRWMYFLGFGLPAVLLLQYAASFDSFIATVLYFVLLPIHAVLSVVSSPEAQPKRKPLPIFRPASSIMDLIVPALHSKLS